MCKVYLYILFIVFYLTGFSQNAVTPSGKKPFEGTIKFVKQSVTDTTYYTYYVKGNKIKFEEHDNCNSMNNCLLFDLAKGTMTAVSPQRKLFINIATKPFIPPSSTDGFEIIKGTNTKIIKGYKCIQWRVRNKLQNTEIAYWVAIDNFTFFEPLMRLWNRAEKSATYFLIIPDIKGVMPFLSEERSLLRENRLRLEVIEIIEKPLNESIFEIPNNYLPFDR